MHDRLPKAGKPAPLSPPSAPVVPRAPVAGDGPGFAGGTTGKPQGTSLSRIHAGETGRGCSTCREDLAVPELNYRLVLRCTSGSIDH